MKQLTLFEGQRMTEKEAIEETKNALLAFSQRYKHWQISFSGGKDSTTLLTVILYLIDTEQIPRPESLIVMYADTRLELPPLTLNAQVMRQEVEKRGFIFKSVMAELDKRFLVYLLGRGVPPPNNQTLRWCTQQIKITPMLNDLQKYYDQVGTKFLSMNGVRLGESAQRDARIHIACNKDGSECGQGHFERNNPDALCDKLSPIIHWRLCHVWDWLIYDCPELGFDTSYLIEGYGGDYAPSLNARTGCVGCPLANNDDALDELIKSPKWSHLKPLREIRHIWTEARYRGDRHRKVGEKIKNGNFGSNPNRVGPISLEKRKYLLERIIEVQNGVNLEVLFKILLLNTNIFIEVFIKNKMLIGLKPIDIINTQEIERIIELIKAKTFPDKWTGDEPLGSELVPQYTKYGYVQELIF
jgi:DNA sulfur modification protein DndC